MFFFTRILQLKFRYGLARLTNVEVYIFSLQLLLFVKNNDSKKVLSEFQEAAKSFKGKVRT